MFLATPHRGSDLAGMLNRVLTASFLTHKPKIYVSELKSGSQTIATMNDQFRHAAPDLDIISFYETAPTLGMVSKVSLSLLRRISSSAF